VAKDESESTRWFKKAAEQGSPLGQARYGIACARGEGTLRNLVEAWAWLQLSDEQRAVEWRDTIEKNLTPKQRARAEARLAELREKYPKRKEPDEPAA
jgi:hypothetical protein